ncbi:MAG: recombinase family protein [Gammaproteobacteria bacterium]|nr:recombinase family protein [Gammaproteobacteria bacterium]
MRQAGGDEILVETGFGANRTRPELEQLLQSVQAGDTVVLVKLDRLARSLTDLLSIVKEIESKGAQLRSLQDPLIDTTTPNSKLIFGIFAVLAEYERELIRRRTLDGLAAAVLGVST